MAKMTKQITYCLELTVEEAIVIKKLVQNPTSSETTPIFKDIFEALPSFEELYGEQDASNTTR